MKTVLCFGELLIDFLSVDQQAIDGLSLKTYRQYPGGAPANAAVAVAKLGGKASFAGQVGHDIFGNFLKAALEHYHVDTQYLYQHDTAKTALAFVELTPDGERNFSFYRHETADLMMTPDQINHIPFHKDMIFHFCSNTLTTDDMTNITRQAVTNALAEDCLISFDVNLRHNLWQGGAVERDRVNLLVDLAHIVKFSREELDYLAEGKTDTYIQHVLSAQCQLLLVTDGGEDMHYYTAESTGIITPPSVEAIDTTAGGDSFIGGLLFALSQLDDPSSIFHDLEQLSQKLTFALCCGACTVTKAGAFPALPEFDAAQTLFKPFSPEFS